jgi:phosphoglucosamine mutase
MGKLFGTDGVRGVPGQYPLDRPTVQRIAAALAVYLEERHLPLRLLLAGDTRASTPVLAAWFAGAFAARGGEVVWAGVLPTPAVSHLLRRREGFGAGAVVSASHNPASDNGIKLLSAAGEKLSAAEEQRIEALLATLAPRGDDQLPGEDPRFREAYLALLAQTLPAGALEGLSVVVDAAHGATAPVAGAFLASLGAKVQVLNANPDGSNINLGCGALHPEGLAAAVVERGAAAGVAFDGDGDRAVLVTHTGRVLTGDHILLLWARALAAQGRLARGTVVATVMSNAALDQALAREGLRLVRCPVGDREVWEAMQREGAVLGGEQSGHVICAHYSVTGDGLLTAAHLLAQGVASGQSLEERADLVPFPQVLVGVRVREKRPLGEIPPLTAAVRRAEAALAGKGRVLVRYSGTEPLLRVMVEAEELARAQRLAEEIATLAEKLLG